MLKIYFKVTQIQVSRNFNMNIERNSVAKTYQITKSMK